MTWFLVASVLFVGAIDIKKTTYTKLHFNTEVQCLKYALSEYYNISKSLVDHTAKEIKYVKYTCEAVSEI